MCCILALLYSGSSNWPSKGSNTFNGSYGGSVNESKGGQQERRHQSPFLIAPISSVGDLIFDFLISSCNDPSILKVFEMYRVSSLGLCLRSRRWGSSQALQSTETASFSHIPVIDFKAFFKGSQAEKSQVANEIVDAFKNCGFIYLKNHGIPASQLETVFAKVRPPIQCTLCPVLNYM